LPQSNQKCRERQAISKRMLHLLADCKITKEIFTGTSQTKNAIGSWFATRPCQVGIN
jgi:hypothetical protein